MKRDSRQLAFVLIAWLVSANVGWSVDFFDFKSSGPSPAKLSLIGDHKNIPETIQWSWQYDEISRGDGAGM